MDLTERLETGEESAVSDSQQIERAITTNKIYAIINKEKKKNQSGLDGRQGQQASEHEHNFCYALGILVGKNRIRVEKPVRSELFLHYFVQGLFDHYGEITWFQANAVHIGFYDVVRASFSAERTEGTPVVPTNKYDEELKYLKSYQAEHNFFSMNSERF